MKVTLNRLIPLSFPFLLYSAPSWSAQPTFDVNCGFVALYWAIPNHYPAFIFPSNEGEPNEDYDEWTNFYAPDQKGNPVPDVVAECYPHTRLGLKQGEKVDTSGMVPYAIPRTMKRCVFEKPEPNMKAHFRCE